MRRSHLQRKIEGVRKTLNTNQSASYGITEDMQCDVEANRIASSKDRYYILIKGKDVGASAGREGEKAHEEDEGQRQSEALAGEGDSDSVNLIDVSGKDGEVNEVAMVHGHIVMDNSSDSATSGAQDVTLNNDTRVVDLTGDQSTAASTRPPPSIPEFPASPGQSLISQQLSTVEAVHVGHHPAVIIPSDNEQREDNTVSTTPPTPAPGGQPQHRSLHKDKTLPLIATSLQIQPRPPTPPVNEISSDSDSEFVDVAVPKVPKPLAPVVVDTEETTRAMDEVQRLAQLPTRQAERTLVKDILELGRRTIQLEKQSASVTNAMYKEAQVNSDVHDVYMMCT